MKLHALLTIAWKNLWTHRLRTFLTLGGVSIGVSSIVFLVSLGFGLERLVTSQVADFTAFTLIDVPSANLKTGKINQAAIERIERIGHVASVDEVVDVAGRIRLKDKEATTETVIVGSTPDYFTLSGLAVEKGHLAQAEQDIAINTSLAGLLGFEDPAQALGQEIRADIILPADLRVPDKVEGPLVRSDLAFVVVGVIQDTANPIAYVPLQRLTAVGAINRTTLKVQVDDRSNVEAVRKAIETSGFSTEYIGDTVAQIAQIFSIFRIILALLGLIALGIAALGMFNTLTISLMERIREVGLLKTLGIQRRDIFKLFMAESLTLGVAGGFLGIVISSALGWGLNAGLTYLATHAGAEQVSVYYTPGWFILVAVALSALLGFVTGLYPALRAIRTDALDVLRYE